MNEINGRTKLRERSPGELLEQLSGQASTSARPVLEPAGRRPSRQ